MYRNETGTVPTAHPRKPALGLAAVICRILDGVAKHRNRRRAMLAHRSLGELPERMLRDIGIEPDGRQRLSALLRIPPF